MSVNWKRILVIAVAVFWSAASLSVLATAVWRITRSEAGMAALDLALAIINGTFAVLLWRAQAALATSARVTQEEGTRR